MDPKDLRIQQKLAELYSRAGDSEEANGIYKKVAKNYSDNGFTLKAIAVYKQMQKLDPDQEEVYHRLAELNAKQGLTGNALAEYRSLIGYLESLERYDEVAGVLQKMKEIDPDNLNLRVKICEIQARGRKVDDAEKELREIFAHLFKNKDINKAIKLLEMFVPLLPSVVDLKIELSEALILNNRAEEGLQMLEVLRRKDPENPRILELLEQGPGLSGKHAEVDEPKSGSPQSESADTDPGVSPMDYVNPQTPAGIFSNAEEERAPSGKPGEPGEESKLSKPGHLEVDDDEEIPLEFLEKIGSSDEGHFHNMGMDSSTSQGVESIDGEAIDLVVDLEDGEGEDFDSIAITSPEGETDAVVDSSYKISASDEIELELELELEDDEEIGAEGEGDLLELDLVLENDESQGPLPDGTLEEAEFYLNQGLLEEAESLCRSLLEKDPGSRALLSLLDKIEKSFGKRSMASDQKGPEEEDFNAFLEEIEDSSILRMPKMGEKDRRMLDGALAEFRRGVEDQVDGEDTETHYNLGIAYKEMGLLEDAIGEFDRAMRDSSRRIDCLTLKGLCLAETGAFERAEESLKEGLSLDGLTADNSNGLLFELGILYERMGRPAEAVKCFQFVIDSDPFFRDVGSRKEKLCRELGLDEEPPQSGSKGRRDKVSYL